jgi:dipeptidyl aminopeptidase/acylaminoacyl peptidase
VRGNYLREFFTLAYIDLASGKMHELIETSWDISILSVSHDGRLLALAFNEDGYSRLELYDVSNGWDGRQALALPDLPTGVLNQLTWSGDGSRLAIGFAPASCTADLWLWDTTTNRLSQLTQSATGGLPSTAFIPPTLIHYPSFDERQIPAFLYLPPGKDAQNMPTILYIHGGPASQSLPSYNGVVQYLVNGGYAVLVPNVRGSSGYGSTYQSLDDVELRMDSVADLKAAAEWLTTQGIADPVRIAVMGGSYGGFMVLSAVTTYPELWAAGVDIVGIANFVTFLEQTGPWRRKHREKEYGSLEYHRELLERISPINAVDRIISPMFILHGANDPRVSIHEAEQIVAALREQNVPVEYLRFEDEGHGLIKRANRLVAYPAIARFLDTYLSS